MNKNKKKSTSTFDLVLKFYGLVSTGLNSHNLSDYKLELAEIKSQCPERTLTMPTDLNTLKKFQRLRSGEERMGITKLSDIYVAAYGDMVRANVLRSPKGQKVLKRIRDLTDPGSTEMVAVVKFGSIKHGMRVFTLMTNDEDGEVISEILGLKEIHFLDHQSGGGINLF